MTQLDNPTASTSATATAGAPGSRHDDTSPAKRGQNPTKIKDSRGQTIFLIVNVVILIGVVLATLIPFVNVIAKAFSSASAINAGRVTFWPVGFNLTTFQQIAGDPAFWGYYRNTVMYTVLGTLISLFMTATYAYAISKKELVGKSFFTGLAVFTMFFAGGLIPNYILIQKLGLMNTIWAVLLPSAIAVFNLLVMKSFFEGFPTELEEAARVDGLKTYGVFFRIVVPLSKAVLATMTLFYAVAYWNSWFPASLYLTKADNLRPVTIYLRNLMQSNFGNEAAAGQSPDMMVQINANIKSVAIILTMLPILCVYPFVQRYFVSGVMLGAVKS
ncbi:MAG: carbohydrate ABC transporter permease [Propionibacteriaceae bacterium]|jgi:putative aldouronate transport system permease protein|nr:carbohydrate ABC transporter permease [Propionibacteriaceae bacterium]